MDGFPWLLFLLFLLFHPLVTSEPTVDQLVELQKNCPADAPYICLKYGTCCTGYEFCYQGACESCFPRAITDDHLLEWCTDIGQYNISQMRNASCGLACDAKFKTSLNNCTDQIIEYQTNISVLNQELANVKKQKDILNDQITEYQTNISVLNQELANVTKEKDILKSCYLGDVWSGVIGVVVGVVVTVVICCLVAFRRSIPGIVTQVRTCLQRNCCEQKEVPRGNGRERDGDPKVTVPIFKNTDTTDVSKGNPPTKPAVKNSFDRPPIKLKDKSVLKKS